MKTIELSIRGMHCASCVGRVERALVGVGHVRGARVNLATEQAVVDIDDEAVRPDELLQAVEHAGYQAELARSEWTDQVKEHRARRAEEIRVWRVRVVVGLLLSLMLFKLSLDEIDLTTGWVMLVLATPLQVVLGWPYYVGAWQRLRSGAGTGHPDQRRRVARTRRLGRYDRVRQDRHDHAGRTRGDRRLTRRDDGGFARRCDRNQGGL